MCSLEMVADSTIGAGDFADTTGRATWVSGRKDSGAPTIRRRLLMVWRRDADGRWRIARELQRRMGRTGYYANRPGAEVVAPRLAL
jgi:ketosteroid isomerase-like protein